MNYRWIGAIMVIAGCGGYGFSLVASHKRKEDMLRQLLRILDFMECQLQYKLTPLPELCRMAAKEAKGSLRELFCIFSSELDNQIAPDASSCMSAALAQVHSLSGNIRLLCSELGHSLGNFDLTGQLIGLESVRKSCNRVLKNLECNREVRLRSYQTLGICTGLALVIIFI